jgi:hypothetical protein
MTWQYPGREVTSIEEGHLAVIRLPKVFTLVECILRCSADFDVGIVGIHCFGAIGLLIWGLRCKVDILGSLCPCLHMARDSYCLVGTTG